MTSTGEIRGVMPNWSQLVGAVGNYGVNFA